MIPVELRPVVINCIENPLEPVTSRRIYTAHAGRTVSDYVTEFGPSEWDEFELVAIVNNEYCPDWSRVVNPGETIGVTQRLQGGGGGGKSIVSTVGMLALTIAAPYLAPASLVNSLGVAAFNTGLFSSVGAALSFATSIIGGGITLLGGLALSAIAGSPSYDSGDSSVDSVSSSPTYSWSSEGNSATEAGTVPVIHGTHLVTPPLIGQYISTDGESQYYNALYLVAGHPVDSINGVIINGQPVANFEDVTTDTRLGATTQTVIDGFGDTFTDTAVGFYIDTDWSIALAPGNTAQALAVSFSFPYGLYYANNRGGLDSQTVTIQIQYRAYGDPTWLDWDTVTITETTQSEFFRYYRIDDLTADQYEIQCKFTTAPPTGARYRNTVYWDYLQEIVYDDFTYPGRSLLAIKAMATDQLSGSRPTVQCLVTRSTVDVYDEDLSAWTTKSADNPAWVAYDYLVHDWYGAGISYTMIDYDRFSEWADYCDTASLTCNLYNESFNNLDKVLNSIIGPLGRAIVVQVGSKFSVIVDKPEDTPVQRFMFNVANVARDSFEVEYLDFDDRFNLCEVTYFDSNLDYDRKTVSLQAYGFDTSGYETNKKAVTLTGCTDRDMAIAYGSFLLNCNRYLTLTASWTASVDAIACQPGDVVDVAWQRIPDEGFTNGRIVSATATTVTLDNPVTLYAGTDYAIDVKLSDDTRDVVNIATVLTDTTSSTWTLDPGWTGDTPAKYDLFSIGEVDTITRPMRIVKITRDKNQKRKITALEYVEEVYTDTAVISDLPSVTILDSVKFLTANAFWYSNADGAGAFGISASWRGNAFSWNVYIREQGGTWRLDGVSYTHNYTITTGIFDDITYEVAVSTGDPGSGETVTVAIEGKDVLPPDVPTLAFDGDYIRWTYPDKPIDFAGYRVRYAVYGTQYSSWATATPITGNPLVQNEYFDITGFSGNLIWMVKAEDRSGNQSENPATAITGLGNIALANVLAEWPQAPLWDIGTITNGAVVSGELVADGEDIWTGTNSGVWWSGNNAFQVWGTSYYSEMMYTWSTTFDATGYLTLQRSISDGAYIEYATNSNRQLWTGVDITAAWTGVDTASWWDGIGDYLPWYGSVYVESGDELHFRAVAPSCEIQGVFGYITPTIDVPDVEETLEDVTILTTGTRLSLSKEFTSIKAIVIGLQDDGGGATNVVIDDKNVTLGPLLHSVTADATCDIRVQGY